MDGWPADESANGTGAAHELLDRNLTGTEHFRAGRYPAAVKAFEGALAGCREVLGADHVDTLTVAGNLGVAQVAAGNRRAGIAQITANLADRVRVLGDTEPQTLTAREALATAFRLNGDVDRAVELAQQVTAQRLRRLGPTDPSTLISRMGLIRAIAAAGDVSSGVAMLSSALRDAEAAYGSDHAMTRAVFECGEHSGLLHRGA